MRNLFVCVGNVKMKINLLAVGKIKENFFSQAILEYQKRISRFCNLNIVEVAEAPPSKSVTEQVHEESAKLQNLAKGFVIALDSRGQLLTSENFAELLDKQMSQGSSEFTILIGGSNGLSDELKDRADFVLSFSKMTFPHQLFRVMVIEQIYRALSINAGLPYHK